MSTPSPTAPNPSASPSPSGGRTFTLIVLFLCKKSLFFDINIKVALYLGNTFLLSLIAEVATVPKMYLSRSDNVFNRFFVKFAWGWNLLLLVPFVVLTAYVYCCGQKQRIVKHHLLRIPIATFFWWFWTTRFNVIDASFGQCGQESLSTKGDCLKGGYLWNGFDISGHTYILIYGSLFLIEEARPIEKWDRIKDHLRNETHYRATRNPTENLNPLRNLTEEQFNDLQSNYTKCTPFILVLFVTITLFQIMWDVMVVCTMLYHHTIIEKLLGGTLAILTWFFTYKIWYTQPSLLPKSPGEGVFRYT